MRMVTVQLYVYSDGIGITMLIMALVSMSLTGCSTLTEASSSWSRQSVEIREGEDLSLSCRVEGFGWLDVVRVTHTSNKQSTTITDNSNVKHPFKKLLRYKVHYELNGTVATVNIHYRGGS